MMNDNLISWPPAYKIKKHAKARGVKIRASITSGLEITVPQRFSLKQLPDVLEQNRDWIIKHLSKLPNRDNWQLPDEINLRGICEQWKVSYVPCQTKLQLIKRPGYELVLIGDIAQKESCRLLLYKWIKAYAKRRLPDYLYLQSERTQLTYLSVQIRDQKTRWGSCSKEKSINLNVRLLFLAPEVMNYVLIHELCHTQHLNHSTRFWQLVKKHDPLYEDHRRLLRRANEIIPTWLSTLS